MDEIHRIPIGDTIDLHSFQPREVRTLVEEYLEEAGRLGFRQVRIVHGRGIGVQREIVHSILKRHSRVASFEDLPDGGSTVATLRPPSPPGC